MMAKTFDQLTAERPEQGAERVLHLRSRALGRTKMSAIDAVDSAKRRLKELFVDTEADQQRDTTNKIFIANCQRLSQNGEMKQGTTAPASGAGSPEEPRQTSPLLDASREVTRPAIDWPPAQWQALRQKGGVRKHHAITDYLKETWAPFLDATGAAVTLEILEQKDPGAGKALRQYLVRHPMPKGLRFILHDEIMSILAERPTRLVDAKTCVRCSKLKPNPDTLAREAVIALDTQPTPQPDQTTAQTVDTAPAWPSAKWKDAREKILGKKNGIITFLRNEWEPFIQKTGTVVTRDILAAHDPEAERGLSIYLERHEMPKGISILYPKQVIKVVSERPELARLVLSAISGPAMR